jgi:hypothetical protein
MGVEATVEIREGITVGWIEGAIDGSADTHNGQILNNIHQQMRITAIPFILVF